MPGFKNRLLLAVFISAITLLNISGSYSAKKEDPPIFASIIDSPYYSDRIFYLQCAGYMKKAIELAKEFVDKEKQKYGTSHRKTLKAVLVLGKAYLADAQYNEALKVLTVGLSDYEKLVGPKDPELKPYLIQLATIYFTLSRFEEGFKINARADNIKE